VLSKPLERVEIVRALLSGVAQACVLCMTAGSRLQRVVLWELFLVWTPCRPAVCGSSPHSCVRYASRGMIVSIMRTSGGTEPRLP
jgi:hypothetical protein